MARRVSFRLSPPVYRTVTLVAALLIATIIVTGGAVRLTQSGLGCPSWPNCGPGRLTPRSQSDFHGMVEFVNRTFTGFVSIAVIVAVLGSFLRQPRRRDLIWLSAGLVIGVIGQIVLGGITVLVDLDPLAVMSHFLLSMVLLADAVVLYHRAGIPDGTVERGAVDSRLVDLGRALLGLVTIVVVTGTVVTNTGPHAGDNRAKRFGFYLPAVARVHGTSVMIFLGAVLVLLYVTYRLGALARLRRALTVLLVLIVAQAGIGYTQYFTGVPPLLVGIHLAGAAAVFTATLALYLRMFDAIPTDPRAQVASAGAGRTVRDGHDRAGRQAGEVPA